MLEKQIVFWDANNTLFNDMPVWYAAASDTLRAFGVDPPSMDECIKLIKSHYLDLYRSQGINASADQLNAVYGPSYETRMGDIELFTNAWNILDILRRHGYYVVLVSFQLRHLVDPLLERLRVTDLFHRVECDVTNKAMMFRSICEDLDVTPSVCFSIGDMPSDMRSSVEANVIPIGFDNGYGDKKEMMLREAGARQVVKDLGELTSLILHWEF